jgi:hypothetical protein
MNVRVRVGRLDYQPWLPRELPRTYTLLESFPKRRLIIEPRVVGGGRW